jgi:hypothetical protein
VNKNNYELLKEKHGNVVTQSTRKTFGRSLEDWLTLLKELCENTGYKAKMNGAKAGNLGVVIVPAENESPQRIAIYPKKTKEAGLVVEMDVYEKIRHFPGLESHDRIKGNRPHYNSVPDDIIVDVCRTFLNK